MVIVAAVDRSKRASQVLDHADILAERFEDEIQVVHVMKRSEAIQAEEESVRNDEQLPIESLRENAREVAAELIDSQSPTAVSEAMGFIGDPATEVVSHASEVGARYIVVSPQRRSQTGKMLFGSVAQSVLLNAPCPVVSLIND